MVTFTLADNVKYYTHLLRLLEHGILDACGACAEGCDCDRVLQAMDGEVADSRSIVESNIGRSQQLLGGIRVLLACTPAARRCVQDHARV